MVKKSTNALVPKLRFPEFRGSAEWKAKRMDSLYSFMRNNTLSRDKLNYEAGTAKNIHYGDIHTRFSTLFDITKERVPFINATEELPHADADDYCIEGDLIFADASEDTDDVGKCIEIVQLEKQHLLAGQHTILARQKNGEFVIGFGGRVFQSARVRSQIQHEAQGTKVYAISPTRLARIEVAYPSDEDEQKKIADCLSSLDELIAAQRRKVEALKTYKRGLMQQLFPREGETLPRLRFPEFRDAPEWEVRALGSFSKVGDIDHKMPSSVTDGIPYIMTGDFFGMNGIDFKNAKKVSLEDYEQLIKKIKPEYGDIVIARYASVGAIRYIEAESKFLVSYSCAIVKCNKSENSKYLYYILQSDVIQSKIGLEINASSQKNIGIDSIKRLNIFLPGFPEQLKIAECLSSLDALFTAATQDLETLKTHKKGLMQQLFPTLEEA